MICHKLKLVYFHPSKTGGTAIEAALLHEEMGDSAPHNLLNLSLTDRMRFGLYFRDTQHWPVAPLTKAYPEIAGWRSIVSVRNPFSRVVSEYRYQRAGHYRNGSRPTEINKAIASGSLWNTAFAWHGHNQRGYIRDDSRIIRQENLTDDWMTVMPDVPPPAKRNVSLSPVELLDEVSVRLIRERFKADFDVLGYSEECPDGLQK